RPIYDDVRQHREVTTARPNNSSPANVNSTPATQDALQADEAAAKAQPSETANATTASTSNTTPLEKTAEKPAPKKIESVGNSKALEFKQRIDKALEDRGLTGRVRVSGTGNALVLAGKLRPAEHAALLKFLRDAPADVRIVDHIEYED